MVTAQATRPPDACVPGTGNENQLWWQRKSAVANGTICAGAFDAAPLVAVAGHPEMAVNISEIFIFSGALFVVGAVNWKISLFQFN